MSGNLDPAATARLAKWHIAPVQATHADGHSVTVVGLRLSLLGMDPAGGYTIPREVTILAELPAATDFGYGVVEVALGAQAKP